MEFYPHFGNKNNKNQFLFWFFFKKKKKSKNNFINLEKLHTYTYVGFKCVESAPIGAATPFPHEYVFSLGFFIILVGSVPLGYFNLDDNIVVQKVACAALWVIVGNYHFIIIIIYFYCFFYFYFICFIFTHSFLDCFFRISWFRSICKH